MAGVPQKTLNWLYDVLKREYHDPNRTYSDLVQTLGQYPSLAPRTDVYTADNGAPALLLSLKGVVPVNFRGTTYRFPVAIWIPHAYPYDAPIAYVTPTEDMVVRSGQHVSASDGRIYHHYLAGWKEAWDRSNIIEFLRVLVDIFSKEPPVMAKSQQMSLQQSQGGPPPVPPPPQDQRRYGNQPPVPSFPGRVGSPGQSGPPPLPPPKQSTDTSQAGSMGPPRPSPRPGRYDAPPPLPPPSQPARTVPPQQAYGNGTSQTPRPGSQYLPQRTSSLRQEYPAQQPPPHPQQYQSQSPGRPVTDPRPPQPPSANYGRDMSSPQPQSLNYNQMSPAVQSMPPSIQPMLQSQARHQTQQPLQQPQPQLQPQQPYGAPQPQQIPHSNQQPMQVPQPQPQQPYQRPQYQPPPHQAQPQAQPQFHSRPQSQLQPQSSQTQHQQQQQQQQQRLPQSTSAIPPTQPKPPPAKDLLSEDDPFQISLPTSKSNLPPPPIPTNPEKTALLATLSHLVLQHLHTQIQQTETTALPSLTSQHTALRTASDTLGAELQQLQTLSSQLQSNISALSSTLKSATTTIQQTQDPHHPSHPESIPAIDQIIIPPTVVARQLYDAVAEQRGYEAAIFALNEAFVRGRVGAEVWGRKMRECAREEMRRKWLVKKIGDGLGLEDV